MFTIFVWRKRCNHVHKPYACVMWTQHSLSLPRGSKRDGLPWVHHLNRLNMSRDLKAASWMCTVAENKYKLRWVYLYQWTCILCWISWAPLGPLPPPPLCPKRENSEGGGATLSNPPPFLLLEFGHLSGQASGHTSMSCSEWRMWRSTVSDWRASYISRIVFPDSPADAGGVLWTLGCGLKGGKQRQRGMQMKKSKN